MKNVDEIILDVGLWTVTLLFFYIVYTSARILLPPDVFALLVTVGQLVFGALLVGVLLVLLVVGAASISEGGFDEGVSTLARRLHRLR